MKKVNDIQALQTISIEQLKNFDGFADISNKEALQIIATLKELSLLTYNTVTKNEQSSTLPKLRKEEQ